MDFNSLFSLLDEDIYMEVMKRVKIMRIIPGIRKVLMNREFTKTKKDWLPPKIRGRRVEWSKEDWNYPKRVIQCLCIDPYPESALNDESLALLRRSRDWCPLLAAGLDEGATMEEGLLSFYMSRIIKIRRGVIRGPKRALGNVGLGLPICKHDKFIRNRIRNADGRVFPAHHLSSCLRSVDSSARRSAPVSLFFPKYWVGGFNYV